MNILTNVEFQIHVKTFQIYQVFVLKLKKCIILLVAVKTAFLSTSSFNSRISTLSEMLQLKRPNFGILSAALATFQAPGGCNQFAF